MTDFYENIKTTSFNMNKQTNINEAQASLKER